MVLWTGVERERPEALLAEGSVVVVGASSAGLFAARLLADQGVPVEVFEQREQLGAGRRTLIITPELRRVLGFVPEAAVVNHIHTLELSTHGATVAVRLREPDLVVERSELVRLLADQAGRAGAKLQLGYRFAGVERADDGARLLFEDRRRGGVVPVAASLVVAADGAVSAVARAAGQPRWPLVTVLQARVRQPAGADPRVAKVWFYPDQTRYFYWLVPESATTAAVGIVDQARTARDKLDRFLRAGGYEPLEYQAALVPLYRPRPAPAGRLAGLEVLFVGDAGGQVKVTTVGGTVTGLRGARAAARAIARGTSYAWELRGLERELRLHWWLRSAMDVLSAADYRRVLLQLRGRLAALLEVHNRDRLSRVAWHLATARPGLALLLARAAWRRGWAWAQGTGG